MLGLVVLVMVVNVDVGVVGLLSVLVGLVCVEYGVVLFLLFGVVIVLGLCLVLVELVVIVCLVNEV